MAYPLRQKFEDKTIRIPDTADIRSDLHSVKRTVSISGNVRFIGERNENGHADRFWALALAVEATDSTIPTHIDIFKVNKERFTW